MALNHVFRLMVCLAVLGLVSSSFAGDWPQWRGPDRDDVSKETGLLKKWPAGGPKLLWTFDKGGTGFAGPAIVDGKLFTMGDRGNQEVLYALDISSGKELWAIPIGPKYVQRGNWGDGSRGTPTVDDGKVYVLASQGDLICVTVDGKGVWKTNLKKYGGSEPKWGYSESPLVDDGRVVCTPGGGRGAIMAFDKKTGRPLWQTKGFRDRNATQYSSIIAVEHNGARQYIQLTMKQVVGLDPGSGKVLWTSDWPGQTAVIPTPIYHEGQVFVSSGYGVGCKSFTIGQNAPKDIYVHKDLGNHHGGVILIDGYLYGHADRPIRQWVCKEFKTGNTAWKANGVGKGSVAYADGMLYCYSEKTGDLALVEASPKGYNQVSRMSLPRKSKVNRKRGLIWTHPVISNGKLYLRDNELIFCFDIKAK